MQEHVRSDPSAVQESAHLACAGTGFTSRKHKQQERWQHNIKAYNMIHEEDNSKALDDKQDRNRVTE